MPAPARQPPRTLQTDIGWTGELNQPKWSMSRPETIFPATGSTTVSTAPTFGKMRITVTRASTPRAPLV